MSLITRPATLARNTAAALLWAGAAAMACAQATEPTTPMQGMHGMHGKPGPGMGGPAATDHRRMMESHHGYGVDGMAGMGAFTARRQAALKAKLKLSTEQETGWSAYVSALTGAGSAPLGMMGMTGMASQDRAALATLTTPERIDRMRDMREKHHEAMKQAMDKRDEATKAFYNTLTSEQKKVFDAETLRRGPRAAHHGPRS
jgi:protein CpxP